MSLPKSVINSFLKGEKDAIEKVYLEYKNLMFFVVSAYVSNAEDVEDIVNESFLKCIENKGKIFNKNNIKSYLVSICRNAAIDFLKEQNKVIYTDIIEELYNDNDKTNNVLNMLEPFLTNKETIVVYYKIAFDYSWKELSEMTGVPISSARLIFKQAIHKLKKNKEVFR